MAKIILSNINIKISAQDSICLYMYIYTVVIQTSISECNASITYMSYIPLKGFLSSCFKTFTLFASGINNQNK